jgi:hypothetical protein
MSDLEEVELQENLYPSGSSRLSTTQLTAEEKRVLDDDTPVHPDDRVAVEQVITKTTG